MLAVLVDLLAAVGAELASLDSPEVHPADRAVVIHDLALGSGFLGRHRGSFGDASVHDDDLGVRRGQKCPLRSVTPAGPTGFGAG